MKQEKIIIFILFSFLIFFSFPVKALKKSDYSYLESSSFIDFPNLKGNRIMLYNLNDNKMVFQENADVKIAIASLTKIMTALVVIEEIANLEEEIVMPYYAFQNIEGYAQAGFKLNEKVTVRDLLYGTLLPSGVEAAQALAIHVSGDIPSFVHKMNLYAQRIGMKSTLFTNPVGRDDINHYSTLEDISKLLFYALENETFYQIYTTRLYKASNGLELKSTLVAPSLKYHLNIDSILGSKSGYTNEAGLCLSSIAEYNGIKYLLILANSLYANGFPNHIVDSLAIYQYFATNFDYLPILEKGKELVTLSIKDGYSKSYTIVSGEDVSLYLKKDMVEDLTYDYEGITNLNYKVKYKDKIGVVQVKYKGEKLYTYEVYLEEKINYRYTHFIVLGVIFTFFLFFFIYKTFKKKLEYKNFIL